MTNAIPARWQRPLGFLLVFGIGGGLLVGHLTHATSEMESVRTFVLGILMPLLFSLAVLAGGVSLRKGTIENEHVLVVGIWVGFLALAFSFGQLLTILYEQAEGVHMSHPEYIVVNAASAGALVGYFVGMYDIRQRRARERAESLQSQLTVLNRVLRHDIRNGATVIKGRAELLEEAMGANEHVERISDRAAALVDLGEQARAIESLQESDGSVREEVEITEIVRDELEMIADRHPDVDITADLGPRRWVIAHPLLDAAVANVLQNAVEHAERDDLEIEVTISNSRGAGGDELAVTIADDGPGIPEEEVAVLERGYETPLDHTSGLGLWLVNWIIEQSGGSVWFEENEPRGSVVHFGLESSGTGNG